MEPWRVPLLIGNLSDLVSPHLTQAYMSVLRISAGISLSQLRSEELIKLAKIKGLAAIKHRH